MSEFLIRVITTLLLINSSASLATQDFWQHVTPSSKLLIDDTQSIRYFNVDEAALRDFLTRVPEELSGDNSHTIRLPMPDGTLVSYSIVESPIMEASLANKFPEIKSYVVYGIDDLGASGRVDISPKGFRGMIYTSQGRVFIDPDRKNSTVGRYLSRTDRGSRSSNNFQCGTNQLARNQSFSPVLNNRVENRIADSLLQYRLAVSATYEYATTPSININGAGSEVSDALAEINTAINRINVIYQRDLGIRLVLVGSGNLIDINNTSPLAGFDGDGIQLLLNNKSWIESDITVNQYDIGHVFSTGAGGLARVASVCNETQKAQGVTGLSDPTGDAFYIDFVAHEIGHQFGAEHTFNGTTSGCSGINRTALSALEPGSGSTIMAYAGICGAENIQANSDATFHSRSIEQINSFVSAGGNCPSAIVSASNPNDPVANAGIDRVIPTGTSYLLQGNGTDSDGDTLSYQWDQIDAGTETSSVTLGDDLGDNALVRTYLPQASGNRDIPALGTQVVDGPYDLSEALPCTARDLNFRLTVRDGKSGQDTDDLKLTVSSTAGPFKITSQTESNTIFINSGAVPITWDVANTSVAPVNCATVDIDLLTFSNDHTTYAVTPLKSGVLNNGNNLVVLPDKSNSNARFRVSCSNNIFYDISDEDLIIQNTGGSGAGTFDTTGNTTFFNENGIVFAASAGTCAAATVVSGSGGGVLDSLWIIFFVSLSICRRQMHKTV
jgi:hypothetical protein